MKITVVGQGYVGLPLAIAAVNSGITVFGLDTNEDKVRSLRAGKSLIEDTINTFIQVMSAVIGTDNNANFRINIKIDRTHKTLPIVSFVSCYF